MADDFFGPPTDFAANVPAETQSNGAVTENSTGEQVANEAGNASWYNSAYPGQTQDAPAPAVNESAAETARLVQQNNIATGTPTEIPSDTASLPSASTSRTTATNYSATTQDAYGLNILNATQTAQLTSRINPALMNGLSPVAGSAATTALPAVNKFATPLDTGAAAELAAVNRSIAADAARLNMQSPNPYLTNIDAAAAEIYKGQEGITKANQIIQSAQQKIATSESIIAQNNAELADPYLADSRRVLLEENNVAQVQNVFEQTQSVNENQVYIVATQEINQINEAVIDINTANYRATTSELTVPVVEVNSDPSFTGPQQITVTQINPTTGATPVNNGESFGNIYPDGFGGFVNGDGQVVDANGLLIPTGNNLTTRATAINTRADGESFGNIYPDGFGGFVNGDGQVVDANGLLIPTGNNLTTRATPVVAVGIAYDENGSLLPGWTLDENNNPVYIGGGFVEQATQEQAASDRVAAQRALAQQQAVTAAQKKSVNNGDWRVRLSLAPGANYLYNDPDNPGILQPLALTSGVIFPYTPKIETAYKADYDSYALTHSNYKGYFYKSSYTDTVNMSATFTAQDTAEANYLLAVIHFFKSVTKMFYGQDAQRGAPPPLVYLTGLGEYQFSAHPCAVTSFTYSLPNDVDYIRAKSTNINGTNMLTRRDRQTVASDPISGAIGRLRNLFSSQGISYGAEICRPPPPTLGQKQPTYVPTRMEINISLLPIQSRQQVSRVFSLKQYANGDLLKGGFW